MRARLPAHDAGDANEWSEDEDEDEDDDPFAAAAARRAASQGAKKKRKAPAPKGAPKAKRMDHGVSRPIWKEIKAKTDDVDERRRLCDKARQDTARNPARKPANAAARGGRAATRSSSSATENAHGMTRAGNNGGAPACSSTAQNSSTPV